MKRASRDRLFLGVDGGGTKTLVAAWDAKDDVIAHARGGRSAIVGMPSEAACRTLTSLIDAALAGVGASRDDVDACAIGLSGIDFADEHPAQLAALSSALALGARVSLVNDGIVALWGATATPAAAVLQHGTAVTSAYRARFGGETCFDHYDAGRQHDLRHEVVVAVARMIDGRAERTPLCERVLAHVGVDETNFHEAVYRRSIVREIAGLAPVVYAAWEDGDPVATKLVDETLADYIATCVVMARRTASDAPYVALGGGVLNGAPRRLRQALDEGVLAACPGAVVGRPQLGPECGAVVMAAHAAGLDAAETFARVSRAHAQHVGEGSGGTR